MLGRFTPPRLYVYLAAEAPVAVVLRRGPSAWARLSIWRTDTDDVHHGQWLAGRVYERRCDLSPDGSLFAYFVMKPGGGLDTTSDSWIALSRPPWFTALALWEVGGTYCSGSFFSGALGAWISGMTHKPDLGMLPAWMQITPSTDIPYLDHTPEWTDRTMHISRLLRGAWTTSDPTMLDAIWERARPGGGATLIAAPSRSASFQTYGGRSVDEYALRTNRGDLIPLGEATWADWDHRGRLVVARGGALSEVDHLGGAVSGVIADFNDQVPEATPSPPEATRWPKAPA